MSVWTSIWLRARLMCVDINLAQSQIDVHTDIDVHTANLSRPPRALHRVLTRHALTTCFAEYF